MLTYAISMIPFTILFSLIYIYGVNIPFFDDWSFVDMIDNFLSGTLSFQDLWAQHNEHRPVTMKIVRLVSVKLTRWNLVSEMMFSAFVALLTFVMIARRITKTFRILTIERPGLLIVFSAISLAGLSQYENWMWGIATHWFMANLFAVSSLFLLISPSLGLMRFLLAVICAMLSFISMGQGFLVFLLGIFVLLIRPGDTNRNSVGKNFQTLGWIFITTIAAFAYWTNYTKPPHHPSMLLFLEQPLDFLKYVSGYQASSLFRDMEFESLLFGAISLVVFGVSVVVAYIKTKKDPAYYWALAPWISVCLYVIGTGFATGLARLGFGWEQALAGRYTTMSSLFFVSLTVLVVSLLKDHLSEKSHFHRFRDIGADAMVYLLIVLTIWSGIRMFHKFPDFYQKRTAALEALVNNGERDKIKYIFPETSYVLEKAQILRKYRLSFFAER